jgi:hypothetical protein
MAVPQQLGAQQPTGYGPSYQQNRHNTGMVGPDGRAENPCSAVCLHLQVSLPRPCNGDIESVPL